MVINNYDNRKPKIQLTAIRKKQIEAEISELDERIKKLEDRNKNKKPGEVIEDIDIPGVPSQNINTLKNQLATKKKLLEVNVEQPKMTPMQIDRAEKRYKWLAEKISEHISTIQQDQILRHKNERDYIKAVQQAKYELTDREYTSWTREYKRLASILYPDDPNAGNLYLLKPDKR